jgi:hypothetical protein
VKGFWILGILFVVCVLLSGVVSASLSDGLVAYWTGDSPTDFNDSVSGAYNAVGIGGWSFTPSCKINGCYGGTIGFNNIALPMPPNYKSLSFAFWAKITTVDTNNRGLISIYPNNNPSISASMYYASSTQNVAFAIRSSTISTLYVNRPDTNWHQYVGTFDDDSQTMCLYEDGLLSGCQSTGGSIYYSTGHFHIGSSQVHVSIDGAMDEIGFWNRSLSGAEVSELYEDNLVGTRPLTNPCLENWTDATARCNSGNNVTKLYVDANHCGTGSPPADNGSVFVCPNYALGGGGVTPADSVANQLLIEQNPQIAGAVVQVPSQNIFEQFWNWLKGLFGG